MSFRRTLSRKSGRLFRTAFEAFWQAPQTLDVADPQVPNLPLLNLANLISPPGITSAEAFGTAVVAGPITVAGISSGEAFGTAVVTGGGAPGTLIPTGIASGEAFGTAVVTMGNEQSIEPTGIASAEVFGLHALEGIDLQDDGIISEEAFGSHTLTNAPQPIVPTGIPSGEAFGNPVVAQSAGLILVEGIPSAEAFGIPTVQRGVAMATGWDTLGSLGAGRPFGLLVPQDLEPFPNMQHMDFNSLTFRRWFEKLAIRVRQQNQIKSDQLQLETMNLADFGSKFHQDLDDIEGTGPAGDAQHWTTQEKLDNVVWRWIAIDT